jgi:hypothetical protein
MRESARRSEAPKRLLVGLALALLYGCNVVGPTKPLASAPALALEITTQGGLAGLFRTGNEIDLYTASTGHPLSLLTGATDSSMPPSVHIVSLGGDTGQSVNTYVFGAAPQGAVQVTVGPSGARADISAGLFLIPLPAKDIDPSQINWSFVSADGSIIATGSGPRG